MKNVVLNRWTLVACGLAVMALVAAPSLSAAPPEKGAKPAATEKPGEKSSAVERTVNKPVAAEAKNPRMPAHFNKVVNGAQRDKVVEILKQYQSQIDEKRAALKAVIDERDAAVMKVLTAEQRTQVEELRAAGEARRQAALAAARAEAAKVSPAPKK
jgi:hypothetical protein